MNVKQFEWYQIHFIASTSHNNQTKTIKMNQIIIFAVIMVIACASAKPSVFAPAALAYTSPLIAAAPLPYVAASSSQVVARNYNGVAVAAPFFAAPAPLIASAAAPALVSPYAAYPRLAASPFAYSGLPLGYSGLPLGYSAY